MNRISLKAVVLGFLLVLVLDVALGVAQLALHSDELFVEGQSDEQMAAALDALTTSASFLIFSILSGTLTTVVGGYVAARIAKRYPYFNGLALGVLGTAFGLAFWSEYPLWFNLAALVTGIPASLLGAHLAVRFGVAGNRTDAP
ncbi:MAG: hypothetical protein HYZ17_04100 [Betaproteobacteria bacterium]|nr:hypothetical protein [Betaproteobacteria bacterium]